MRSNVVRANLRRKAQHGTDRASGMPRSQIRQGSHRTADSQVINIYRLPSMVNGVAVQDAAGHLLYIDGYSDPGGPDVGAPGGG